MAQYRDRQNLVRDEINLMFKVGDRVEDISDGRSGTIKNLTAHADAVNKPNSVEVVVNCLVCFGNDITSGEWFKPDQLRPVK
jgi:hypothetical protein